MQTTIGNKLRESAESLTPKIEHLRRELTQNPTPKRMREYRSRVHDAGNLERCQKAMLAVADAYDNGGVPRELANIKTKAAILPLVSKAIESRGYYDVFTSDKYLYSTPEAVALQRLLEGSNGHAQDEAERAKAQQIVKLEAQIQFADIPGFFPTPKPIIDQMIAAADIQPLDNVLEPSAGRGDIVQAVLDHMGGTGNVVVHYCEIMHTLRELIYLKTGLSCASPNFFDLKTHGFQRILMNPPFERGADAEHIQHAFDLLAPGGRLVAIASEGIFTRSDRKAMAFRIWFDGHGGVSNKLEAGAFTGAQAFRQTGVSCRMLVMDKTDE